MPSIEHSAEPLRRVKADVLVAGFEAGPDGLELCAGTDIEAEAQTWLLDALRAVGATGREGEVHVLPSMGMFDAAAIAVVGLDPRTDEGRRVTLRNAAAAAARALSFAETIALAIPAADAAELSAILEGAILGAYEFEPAGSSAGDRRKALERLVVVSGQETAEVSEAIRWAGAVAEAVNWARDLGNTPAGSQTPTVLASEAHGALESSGLEVTVFDEEYLRANGYGGIVGVAQGSAHPPALVRATWVHPDARRHLALIGKGITFDSGGLSLKDPGPMEAMKIDMAGAAAVFAAVAAIARLGLAVNVTAWAPLAENMPSGTALRPSDVISMYNGRTIEVLNTDAEGRLVLGDAIARAAEDKPDLIVDIATLTGAVQAALGRRTAAVMSNDEWARDLTLQAAELAGEALWPMPMPPELRATLKSSVADMANKGDRDGGMLVAAHFLNEFVPDGTPWAHIDIGGTAFNDRASYGFVPAGATGWGVLTLIRLGRMLADADA